MRKRPALRPLLVSVVLLVGCKDSHDGNEDVCTLAAENIRVMAAKELSKFELARAVLDPESADYAAELKRLARAESALAMLASKGSEATASRYATCLKLPYEHRRCIAQAQEGVVQEACRESTDAWSNYRRCAPVCSAHSRLIQETVPLQLKTVSGEWARRAGWDEGLPNMNSDDSAGKSDRDRYRAFVALAAEEGRIQCMRRCLPTKSFSAQEAACIERAVTNTEVGECLRLNGGLHRGSCDEALKRVKEFARKTLTLNTIERAALDKGHPRYERSLSTIDGREELAHAVLSGTLDARGLIDCRGDPPELTRCRAGSQHPVGFKVCESIGDSYLRHDECAPICSQATEVLALGLPKQVLSVQAYPKLVRILEQLENTIREQGFHLTSALAAKTWETLCWARCLTGEMPAETKRCLVDSQTVESLAKCRSLVESAGAPPLTGSPPE